MSYCHEIEVLGMVCGKTQLHPMCAETFSSENEKSSLRVLLSVVHEIGTRVQTRMAEKKKKKNVWCMDENTDNF